MKTNAERQKARYIKERLALGKATAEQRAWYARYKPDRTDAPVPPPPRQAAPPRPVPPPVEHVAPAHHVAPEPPPAEHRPEPPPPTANGWEPIPDWGAKPENTAPLAPVSTCSIPDCPACRAATGPAICGTTGKRVWPPMSEAGAEGMAKGLLFIIGLVASVIRKEPVPPPTDRDIKQVGRALREVALRRASWVGAFDDLIALTAGISGYTRRALTEKAPPSLPGAS